MRSVRKQFRKLLYVFWKQKTLRTRLERQYILEEILIHLLPLQAVLQKRISEFHGN